MTGGRGEVFRSLLYELNPVVKLIVFISVIQMTAISVSPASYVFFTILFIGILITSGIQPKIIITKTKPFALILAFTFMLNFAFGSGLFLSFSLTYRFLMIIMFSLLLTITTEPKILASVILAPFKGTHAKNLKIVFMVAMEFIPVLIDEFKITIKNIKAMPEYTNKPYRAVFKPELYLKPMIEGIAEKSVHVAQDVEKGKYEAHPITRPKGWEIGLALCAVVLAVKYALL